MQSSVILSLAAMCLAGCAKTSSTDASNNHQANQECAGQDCANHGDLITKKVENDLLHITYTYPGFAVTNPALNDWLEAQYGKQLSALQKEAQEARVAARSNDYTYRPYQELVDWSLAGQTAHWISLSAQIWRDAGGAHGNTAYDAMLWDKTAKKRVEPESLFVSPKALKDAGRSAYCAGLKKERAERGIAQPKAQDTVFPACPKFEELTMVLQTSDPAQASGNTKESFVQITMIAPPYVAGPYAEGPYFVVVPVTSQILAAVKPEYRDDFSVYGE